MIWNFDSIKNLESNCRKYRIVWHSGGVAIKQKQLIRYVYICPTGNWPYIKPYPINGTISTKHHLIDHHKSTQIQIFLLTGCSYKRLLLWWNSLDAKKWNIRDFWFVAKYYCHSIRFLVTSYHTMSQQRNSLVKSWHDERRWGEEVRRESNPQRPREERSVHKVDVERPLGA